MSALGNLTTDLPLEAPLCPGASWYRGGMLRGVYMCHALYLPTEPLCLYNTR